MAGQGRAKWRTGHDGLLAAMMQRAALDLQATWHIHPAEAERLSRVTSGNTVPLDCCRFSDSLGFDSPAQELMDFFNSERLESLLDLCGVKPVELARRVLCQTD